MDSSRDWNELLSWPSYLGIEDLGCEPAEILRWGNYYVEIAFVLRLITFGAVIHIIWKQNNPAVKLAWIVPILMFPLLGGVLYLAFGHVFIPKKLRDSMNRTDELVKKNLLQDEQVLGELEQLNPAVANQSKY